MKKNIYQNIHQGICTNNDDDDDSISCNNNNNNNNNNNLFQTIVHMDTKK